MPTNRRTTCRLALLVLVVLSLLGTSAAPVAASPEERRLAETKAKIADVRRQIEAAKSTRATHAEELAAAQQQLDTVLEALGAAEQAVQRQQQQVASARAELDRLRDAETVQKQKMANRAVALYRQGTSVPFAAVLSSSNAEQALQRSTFVEVISRADQETIEGVEIAQVATDAQRRTLEAEEATLQRVVEQQRDIVAQVEELRNERAMVLAGAEEKLADLQSQERHLEAESREIAALARAASQAEAGRAQAAAASRSSRDAATAQPASAGGSGGGGWQWPASGAVTSEYGRRWGRMHEGIDIGAPTGAAVVAARAGRVSFAGSMGGYGILVLVDHGGGVVTAYAHLSSFAVGAGAQVGAGTRLGSIGCTGSCTGPHLHFEVRVNGSPRNPRQHLG
jgi:septal ring factor EnvC (AmiA/AmiB activator)